MTTKKTFRAIVVSSSLLMPLTAAAQEAGAPAVAASAVEDSTSAYTSAIDVGPGYQSGNAFLLGKYTGMTDQGVFGVANVAIRGGDASNTGGTRYWELLGSNLGLTSREISGKYGNQGQWGVAFFYDELPFYQSDSASSIFGNAGGSILTLPAGLPTNTTAANALQLLPFLRPQDFSLDRKIVGGGFSVQPGTAWQFSTTISHEHKDGLQEQSLSVNDRTDPAFFPEPVNYDVDLFEATAAYSRPGLQLQFGYNFSNFSDSAPAVLVPSPYLGALSQPVGAVSQYALPPSNTAHDINVATAYNITPTTRVNVNLGYGLQLQNGALLPYTINPTIATSPLPRTSLGGDVRTYLAQARVAAHPLPKLDVSGDYTYDKREDETPQNAYQAIEEPDWQKLLFGSVPFGFTDKTGKLDANYRLAKRTKVAVDYTYQETERTVAEVTKQTENTVRAKLSQEFGAGTGYVSYLYGDRNAADYQPYAFDLALGNLPSTTPLLPYPNNGNFNGYLLEPNYYLFRRFFEADRTRKEVKAGTNLNLGESVSLELSGRRTQDDYTHSAYGITDANSWAADADLTYAVVSGTELHGFYTYESILSDQTSLASTGIVSNLPTSQWTWTDRYKDGVHTLGLGATWEVIKQKLKVGSKYQLSLGNTEINVVSGSGPGTSYQYVSLPVPPITTSSYGAKLFGDYLFRPNLTLRVAYDYEHVNTKDPALNTGPLPNTATTSLAGVVGAPSYAWLLGGDSSGAYRISVVTASVIWRF